MLVYIQSGSAADTELDALVKNTALLEQIESALSGHVASVIDAGVSFGTEVVYTNKVVISQSRRSESNSLTLQTVRVVLRNAISRVVRLPKAFVRIVDLTGVDEVYSYSVMLSSSRSSIFGTSN